jgi:hypothetical protein
MALGLGVHGHGEHVECANGTARAGRSISNKMMHDFKSLEYLLSWQTPL